MTYLSQDLNDRWNIFLESFDGVEYTVNLMNKETLEMRTVATFKLEEEQ